MTDGRYEMDIKQVKREVRRLSAGHRGEAVFQLIALAHSQDDRDEALLVCVDLCSDGLIGREELAPHIQAVLAFWGEYFQIALPLQQDPGKLDWILDSDYAPVRRRGGILLDLMGYLPTDLVENSLREAFALTDPRLKMFAALSLLRNFNTFELADLNAIGASHEIRLLFWEQLEKLEMQSLMPELWATPEMLAASDLSRWASSPCELGAPPEEIEWMAICPVSMDGKTEDIYLFRFREFPKPWEPDEGWFAGIAGPFRDGKRLRSPWSRFESWNSQSPEQHFIALIGVGDCS
jgi:hypothetical protein